MDCAAVSFAPSFPRPFSSLLFTRRTLVLKKLPHSNPSRTSIPCSAAVQPERWPHPVATSWRRVQAAHVGASLPLPSPSNLAPPPVARRLPPVGLLLRGSRLVDPARGRVAGPPDTSTPAPTGLQQLSPGQPSLCSAPPGLARLSPLRPTT